MSCRLCQLRKTGTRCPTAESTNYYLSTKKRPYYAVGQPARSPTDLASLGAVTSGGRNSPDDQGRVTQMFDIDKKGPEGYLRESTAEWGSSVNSALSKECVEEDFKVVL
ncbi:hypothetical protein CaCOL14_002626 [Colletotrichum acutatum]